MEYSWLICPSDMGNNEYCKRTMNRSTEIVVIPN